MPAARSSPTRFPKAPSSLAPPPADRLRCSLRSHPRFDNRAGEACPAKRRRFARGVAVGPQPPWRRGGGTMRMFRLLRTSAACAACWTLAASALAQPPAAAAQTPDAQALRDEMAQLRREFEQRMSALESRLAAVEGAQPAAPAAPTAAAGQATGAAPAGAATAAPPPGAPQTAQVPAGAEGAGGPTGALPVYGNASAASKVFNPDMAVI